MLEPFLIGRIVKRVKTNRRGDFFIVLSEGRNSRRFRCDAILFANPDAVQNDSLISFRADEDTRRTKKIMPRVRQILFEATE